MPVWTAAVRAGAGYIVSHNTRDFTPRDSSRLCRYDGIEFITTENFVINVLGLDLDQVAAYPIPPSGRLAHRRQD